MPPPAPLQLAFAMSVRPNFRLRSPGLRVVLKKVDNMLTCVKQGHLVNYVYLQASKHERQGKRSWTLLMKYLK